jgi:hypothetical protein
MQIMNIDWNLMVFLLPFVALILALAALILGIAMHLRVSKIFRSANAPDIERLLKLHTKTIEDLLRFQAESTLETQKLGERIKKKVASAETLRFNPFPGEGVGGNQSFSVCLADEEGNGNILTSMHTRERTNVFAKPIKNWQSEYELTEEEKRAIENSKSKPSNLTNKK